MPAALPWGTVYYDSTYTIGTKTFRNWWNSGYGFVGYHNIRDGIIYSMNVIAVRCMMETVTPQLGVEYAENMGITSLVRTTWARPLPWAASQKEFPTWR